MAPCYMQNFTCIGEKCEDSCCIGWQIPIDEGTYKKYKKVKNKAFKIRLEKELVQKRSHPTVEHAAKIKLKNGRCAFLSQKGLCDIYTVLGKKYLSHTCSLYPRTINQINGKIEYSLICSCPEAARQILLGEKQMRFEDFLPEETRSLISADITIRPLKPENWRDYFLSIRSCSIKILQNRQYAIDDRIKLLGYFMEDLEKYKGKESVKKISGVIKEYYKMCDRSEPIIGRSNEAREKAEIAGLFEALWRFRLNKKIKSERYKECLEETFLGLGQQEKLNLEVFELSYKKAYEEAYSSFIKDREYMLENYFVNYIFERCMPLDSDGPAKSFRRMKLYEQLIKLHIAGITAYNKEFTQAMFIKLIQSLTKTFDHDDETLMFILKSI